MTSEASSQERVTPWRGRWAHIVLMVGVAVAIAPLFPHMPREQVLVFRNPRAPIAKLDATWTPDGDDSASGGFTVNVGLPAREVVHKVSLPNGRYTLAIQVDRTQSRKDSSSQSTGTDGEEPVDATVIRQVTLSGGETIIGL